MLHQQNVPSERLIVPKALRAGDCIRVIAPARSAALLSAETINQALKCLKRLKLQVTFGAHISERDLFDSSSLSGRLRDLHEAFLDTSVQGVLTVLGGFNSKALLREIDYSLIRDNPKVFCGYSDITSLQQAFYAKAGLMSYSGPHFSSFGMKRGFRYSEQYFQKAVFSYSEYEITSSKRWSEDEWYLEQDKRQFQANAGFVNLGAYGTAEGFLFGGNLTTLISLFGTEYLSPPENILLFIEEEGRVPAGQIDGNIEALLLQPWFSRVKGVLCGRFASDAGLTIEMLRLLFQKNALRSLPIIGNVDFGHTNPMITLPFGARCKLEVAETELRVKILARSD